MHFILWNFCFIQQRRVGHISVYVVKAPLSLYTLFNVANVEPSSPSEPEPSRKSGKGRGHKWKQNQAGRPRQTAHFFLIKKRISTTLQFKGFYSRNLTYLDEDLLFVSKLSTFVHGQINSQMIWEVAWICMWPFSRRTGFMLWGPRIKLEL